MQPKPLRAAATRLLRLCGLYHPMRDLRRDRAFRGAGRQSLRRWEAAGRPAPPPDILKYARIREYAKRHCTPILIETGTFHGDAVFTLRRAFREIHSIELDPRLHARAVADLGHLRHVHLHLGDSSSELARVAGALSSPALFWLDGHFCAGPSARGRKDTPIFEELSYLLARPPGANVVLIDDARLFTGRDGYPALEQLREMVASGRPSASFEVDEDIIRILPV